MVRNAAAGAVKLDFGDLPARAGRHGLRLATPSGVLRGPEKYRLLDLKRRRAQIRARRVLELTD